MRTRSAARRAVLGSILGPILAAAIGCGGSGTPPDGDGPCPAQGLADFNEKAGLLARLLYDLDLSPLLLVKGATGNFETTVSGHPPIYTSQEMYDVLTAALTVEAIADSARALALAVAEAADTLDRDGAWAPLLDRWIDGIEESVARGESLFVLARDRGRSVGALLEPLDTAGAAIALACRARDIAPEHADLAAFFGAASDEDWVALLPSFLACAKPKWSEGHQLFIYQLFAARVERADPLLGPVGLHLAGEVAAAAPGWNGAAEWAGGTGSLRIVPGAAGLSGTGLAIVLPESSTPRGSTYRPYFLAAETTIPGLPAGSYRLLAFQSGSRPYASEPFPIETGGTAVVSTAFAPLSGDGCTPEGGAVPVVVFDPTSVEHLANDYDLVCRTEVWEGSAIYQIDVAKVPGYRVRAVGTFRAIVDCSDLAVSGEGSGTVELIPVDPGACTAASIVPDTFTFRIEGGRTQDMIVLGTRIDPAVFLVNVSCPDDSTRVENVSASVFPDRQAGLSPGTSGHAETRFPPGSTPESPFYTLMEVDRIY